MHPAGLYVHVPFCARKCLYCDFYSLAPNCAGVGDDHEGFVTAVLAEAHLAATDWEDQRFDTLYLGGGTPSWIPAPHLTRLLTRLLRPGLLTWAEDLEITVEANPDDVNEAWLKAIATAGVNRLSLGIQSFDDAELAWMGRRHDTATAKQAVDAVRQAGFRNLSLDLIYGLPGQTLATWERSLAAALAYSPEHLSCYQLTIEARTPLGRQHADTPLALPAEENARDFFLTTVDTLDSAGYEQYEVSSFARRDNAGASLRSRHNQKYWQHTPYLGLGPAAHSYRNGRRRWNPRDLEAWQRPLAAGGAPPLESEVLSSEQLTLERLMLGLRTSDGVPMSLVAGLPKGSQTADALLTEGLLTRQGDQLKPTRAGLLVADSLPLRFRV